MNNNYIFLFSLLHLSKSNIIAATFNPCHFSPTHPQYYSSEQMIWEAVTLGTQVICSRVRQSASPSRPRGARQTRGQITWADKCTLPPKWYRIMPYQYPGPCYLWDALEYMEKLSWPLNFLYFRTLKLPMNTTFP